MDYFNVVSIPYVLSFIIGVLFFVFSIFERRDSCLLNKTVSREKADVFLNLPDSMKAFVFFISFGFGGMVINLLWYVITDSWLSWTTSIVLSPLPSLFFGHLLSVGVWDFWPYVMTRDEEREREVIGNVAVIKSSSDDGRKTTYQAEVVSVSGQLIEITIGSDVFDEKFTSGDEVVVFGKGSDGFYFARK